VKLELLLLLPPPLPSAGAEAGPSITGAAAGAEVLEAALLLLLEREKNLSRQPLFLPSEEADEGSGVEEEAEEARPQEGAGRPEAEKAAVQVG
jgi:hypothetical protein